MCILIPDYDYFERIFLGFGVGTGFLAFVTTIILLYSDLSTLPLITIIIISYLILAPMLLKRQKRWKDMLLPKLDIPKLPPGLLKKLLITISVSIIVLTSVVVITSLLVWPVHAWDALTLYDFRARLFALGKGFEDLSNLSRRYYFSYPLLTTSLHTSIYLDGLIDNAKVIYVLYYIGFIYLFYKFLRRNNVDLIYALISTAILVMNPLIFRVSKIAYSNLPHLFYLTSSTYIFYDWLKKKNKLLLLLSSMLLSISIFVRVAERLYLPALSFVFLLLLLRKIKIKELIIYSLPVFVMGRIWNSVLISQKIAEAEGVETTNEVLSLGISGFSITRLLEVTKFYVDAISEEYIYFLLFLIVCIILKLMQDKFKIDIANYYLAYLVIATLGLLFVGNYFISFSYPTWRSISYSLQRSALVVVPLTLAFYAVTTASFIKKKRN